MEEKATFESKKEWSANKLKFKIPVHNARKFSAVLGATSWKSCDSTMITH
jgi:hypothetical protein